MSEQETQFTPKESNESKDQNIEEEEIEKPFVQFSDLIRMYYFEAKSSINPFYEKHLTVITNKLKYTLLVNLKQYLSSWDTVPPIETKEGALYSYMTDFEKQLREKNNPAQIARIINLWIMFIHERLKISIGEELLGFSERSLRSLNYIDINAPIEDQERIIFNKLDEEDARYNQNKKYYW